MPITEHYNVGYKQQVKIELSLISLRPGNTQTYIYRLKRLLRKNGTVPIIPPWNFHICPLVILI